MKSYYDKRKTLLYPGADSFSQHEILIDGTMDA